MEIINLKYNLFKKIQSKLKNLRGNYVIVVLSVVVLLNVNVIKCDKDYNGLGHDGTDASAHIFVEQCMQKCPDQNRSTDDDSYYDEDECRNCYINQCSSGCYLWEAALDSSCQVVCNKTNKPDLELKELYCVMGCNDALGRYFKWLKQEIGTPPAPALVAESLSAYSLSLSWSVPPKFYLLARGKTIHNYPTFRNYLVQWRYEEFMQDWKFSVYQSIGDNSTIRLDNLQPYTKYRFRIALLLSDNHDEFLLSDKSTIISTLAEGVPTSKPNIIRCAAVDQTRISISWESGPFSNGPILSYVLKIKDQNPAGYFAVKDIPAKEKTSFHMFEKLAPNHNYSLQLAMQNAEGTGPFAEIITSTLPYYPAQKDDDNSPDPKLLVTTENTILLQGANMVQDDPTILYSSEFKILGMAIHVYKQSMYISDEAGSIILTNLGLSKDRKIILSQSKGLKFKPTLLSVDWLNDHLYILGETRIENNSKSRWQISRCTLNGDDLVVAVDNLNHRPVHFEVDPYNGFLFWVTSGSSEAGLFRLDLLDIDSGIIGKYKQHQMIKQNNLGAFTVDHTRFRLLVTFQEENTIFAVSLDGKEREDIRKNTQTPKLHLVKSIAIANGIFYWTNGIEILNEEYHTLNHNYFHNSFPADAPVIAVCVNNTHAQPIPVPVNPPTSLQALLSSDRAKISWKIPFLLGNQGKGAWQKWNYELEIREYFNTSYLSPQNGENTYTISNLKPNTTYKFRAAAYTKAGRGPWSQEFNAKTLKSSDERLVVWSTNSGLMQSDIIGENIVTLIPKSDLSDAKVTDFSWYEDLLYFVSNSTVKLFNRTSGHVQQLTDLNSVEAIAVDWIGKRLYWSSPSQQLIVRGTLYGELAEFLPIIAVAHEIKIDALRGNLYFSSPQSIDTCRLNGKNRRNYFFEKAYTGKTVMGLTLDLEKQRIYWVVRSYSESVLYNAPLADSWDEKSELIEESVLEEHSLIGRLNYFSDRLLWLRDDKTVAVGDVNGKNFAVFGNDILQGLQTISVIDPTQLVFPDTKFVTNVIPETVKNHSISISGNYRIFNITWEPVENVNHGHVFYDIKVKAFQNEFSNEQLETAYQLPPNTLPPYTFMEIFIRPFTYWGSASVVRTQLYSPAAPPSPPTNPRVFITYQVDPTQDDTTLIANFRWGQPKQLNGIILGFKVKCFYRDHGIEKFVLNNTIVSGLEKIITGLKQNFTYTFQVLAYTSVGDGDYTEALHIHSHYENPVPRLLVSTYGEILEVDMDLQREELVLNTVSPVVALGRIEKDKRLFWFNENRELYSYSYKDHTKSKLLTATSEVLAMTVDWVERTIFWSQMEKSTGVIYSYNLNRAENIHEPIHNRHAKKVLERQGTITDLVVSPFDRKLFWIENFKNLSDENTIYYYHLDSKELRTFFEYPDDCLNKTIIPETRSLVLSTSAINPTLENIGGDQKYMSLLIFADTHDHFIATDIKTKECFHFENGYYSTKTNLAKDSVRLYWITEEVVYARNDLNQEIYSFAIAGATKLLSFYQQNYPKKNCLFPDQSVNYQAEFVNSTEDSITIKLPKAHLPAECYLKVIPIKYSIHYLEYKQNDHYQNVDCMDNSECYMVHSYEDQKTVERLKPFTKYFFQIGLSSVYGNDLTTKITLGKGTIFETQAGAPSEPRNVSAITLSFSEVKVSWMPPDVINSHSLSYEVHWQTEKFVGGVKNRPFLQIPNISRNDLKIKDPISVTLVKLLPNISYKIWIFAYATKTAHSESEAVLVTTYPEPGNLILNSTAAYNLTLKWTQPENVFKYVIQYSSPEISDWVDGFTSDINPVFQIDERNNTYYFIGNLLPKTKYQFSLKLYYINSPSRAYRWPPQQTDDPRYVFETLGDSPGKPGRPTVELIRVDLYKVFWEPARENGAIVEEYYLETKRLSDESYDDLNRVKRFSNDTNDVTSFSNKDLNEVHLDIPNYDSMVKVNEINSSQNQDFDLTTTRIETFVNDNDWKFANSVQVNFWIVQDLYPVNDYVFRVKARNSYGWGPYSDISEIYTGAVTENPNNSNLELHKSNHVMMLIFALPISITVLLCCFAVILVVICRKHRIKKLKEDSMPIPDLELANLRDINTGENLIQHNRNILYAPHFYGLPQNPVAELLEVPQIKRDQIQLSQFLGAGAFGEVHEGFLFMDGDGQYERVAIKTLRKGASEIEKDEFLKEAELMSNFKHPNILKLVGICLNGHNSDVYIIMELMEGGDLLSYLRSNRPTVKQPSTLTLLDLITMCVDVAAGCRYLEEMHFVHRDLACRNCLISFCPSGGRIVKIGDFGLARDIYKNDYYRKEGEGLMPVRWMSPESLLDGVFTSQSDIWAFGVLCWEIMTMGYQPYPGMTNLEVLQYVKQGGRLERSADCPEELFQLMLKCWIKSADQRPTFRYCLETLKSIQAKTSPFTVITMTTSDTFKYWSSTSTGSSGLHSGMNLTTATGSGIPIRTEQVFRPIEPVTNTNCSDVTKPTAGVPKYLELMYDDSQDSNSEQSLQIPVQHSVVPQIPQGMIRPNSREIQSVSQRNSLAFRPNNIITDDGYEIPISDFPNDRNNNKNSVTRSLSNSSTMPSVDPEEIRKSLEQALQLLPNRNSHPLSLGKQTTNKLINDSHSNESLMQRNVA